ncbi:MAG: efflux RND transporter periplasmic adaptor subunit [Tepidisphaeraceae bacterium]
MSTPSEISADETKVYDGKPAETPHAVPNTDHGHGGHDGPQMNLEPMPTGVVALLGVGFLGLLAVLLVLGWLPRQRANEAANEDMQAQANMKPVVGVSSPKPPAALPALEIPGDAQAFQVTDIYPRASGYLKKRLVDIGDKVQEGQLLAEIDAPEVVAQLAAAKAGLEQSRAAAAKARDDFNLTEATYQRYETFAKTGGVTQQQLDERRSAFTSAKATLAAADANVQAGEAEVERLTSLVGFTKVTAPFTGTITTRGYDVGALLSAGSAGREIFQIAQVDTLRVFIDIPQSYASFVIQGSPVQFNVRNFPGKKFDGFIARTSGAISQSSRTMRVEADFPNKEGLLYPGMYGTVRYEMKQNAPELVIPSSALVFGPDGMRVALVDADNKVRYRNVSLGADLGTEVEITKGVEKSDRVISNPSERLIEGLEVQIASTQKKENAAPADKPTQPSKSETAAR